MNTSTPPLPDFNSDPAAHLQALCNHVPSLDAFPNLGGTVASFMKEEENSALSALYLKAVAQHLPIFADTKQFAKSTAKVPPPLAAAAVGPTIAPQNAMAMQDSIQTDLQNSQTVYEISEALSYVAARCQPRSLIAESGILPVLERLLPSKISEGFSNSLIFPGAPLVPLHADLLQIHLYAGSANEAERIVSDTWPRPSRGSSILTVLRYYYLRGLVHMQCGNWEWATRCFWTCLSIPADATSAFAVAAWKKLVLLQSLRQSDQSPAETSVMKTPKTTPVCVSRFLNQAINSGSSGGSGGEIFSSNAAPGDMVASIVGAPEDVTSPHGSSTPLLHKDLLSLADGVFITSATPTSTLLSNAESAIRVYADLVRAFVKIDRQSFGKSLALNAHQFLVDGNEQLVQRVDQELARRQIFQWSRVFSAISVEELGERLSMTRDALDQLLLSLTDLPHWTIEIKDEMIFFPKLEPSISGNSGEDLTQLMLMMKKLDASLSTSSKFMSLVRKDSPHSADGGKMGPHGVEDM